MFVHVRVCIYIYMYIVNGPDIFADRIEYVNLQDFCSELKIDRTKTSFAVTERQLYLFVCLFVGT